MSIENGIATTANDILWLWRELILEGNEWHEVKAKQSYHDALNAMKANGLIEDFDVVNVRVRINGEWDSSRREIEFTSE